jgi:hypothetical protein
VTHVITRVDRLLWDSSDEDGPSGGLDEEGSDVGEHEEEDDALGADEEVAVRLEVAGETAEENIVAVHKI